MKIIDNSESHPSIVNFRNHTYCFHIKFPTGLDLYLTESDKSLIMTDKIFVPNSGLTIKEGWFNDSAKNYIILEGVFENNGIDKHMDLTEASVKIYLFFENSWTHFITYRCVNYTKGDLSFMLRLEPYIEAYNQSVLQSFSKNCRTNFGDARCKIDKTAYSQTYNIKEIFAKTIIIEQIIGNFDQENGYYNYGDAILGGEHLEEEQFCSKILSHSEELIILDKIIPDNIRHNKFVRLIAGCDKKFITCCNKFNNTVNFRGEPLIPDDGFIKVI
jgi:uncharacterized phage protein (TIGR02218 family)